MIMDHRMNGIGDLSVLKALRQTRSDVPAIILTERGALDSYLKASSLGVAAYHENPIRNRELLRIIADALGDRVEDEGSRTSAYACCETVLHADKAACDRAYAEMISS